MRLFPVIGLALALVGCGGGGSDSAPGNAQEQPVEYKIQGLWSGVLTSQFGKADKSISAYVTGDEIFVDVGADITGAGYIAAGTAGQTLEIPLYSHFPIDIYSQMKTPAIGRLDGRKLVLSVELVGSDLVGTYKIMSGTTTEDMGVVAAPQSELRADATMPLITLLGQDRQFGCGQDTDDGELLCRSQITFDVDANGGHSGEYRVFHGYQGEQPGMISGVPDEFSFPITVEAGDDAAQYDVSFDLPIGKFRGSAYQAEGWYIRFFALSPDRTQIFH